MSTAREQPSLRERELRARQNVRPFLHRPTLHISFGPLKDDLAKAQPASLCDFLTRRGVRAEVVEEVPTMPDVQLHGLPDLDLIQALIDHWQAGDGDGAGRA
jgi:hypothetical protein